MGTHLDLEVAFVKKAIQKSVKQTHNDNFTNNYSL